MVPVSVVKNAINILKKEGVEKLDPMIFTQASTQSKFSPLCSASMNIVALICRSLEFPSDKLCGDISRVLKPGGTVLPSLCSQSVLKASELSLCAYFMVENFYGCVKCPFHLNYRQTPPMSTSYYWLDSLMHSHLKLAMLSRMANLICEQITVKKRSWKVGSSFSIKKVTKILPKVQIDDDLDLIDEDSLLTEEDLKKPQSPGVGDCEVGKTRKACKNCTCGRAEAETKVQLGPTAEQLNNPQSACGSCGLGNAFRCGTCPYKGLPPFKLGEKVHVKHELLLRLCYT
ncbi:anamorsin homolog [Lycium barbarum]|uniref:anamorsin homolog n=1 Tax=Lycium barbarum TaxID=112863 RepID=UPI00293F500D|nr:anamorsin homolog [Lycium barbarum]